MNIEIANVQQIMINKIITFIKENNYYGEKYHNYNSEQIKATKWWINKFYPNSNNEFKKLKNELSKEIKDKYEWNNSEIKTFFKNFD